MDNQQVGLGEYLAQLPYLVGHELGDEHVVISVFGADQCVIANSAVEWDSGRGDQAFAQYVGGHLAAALGRTEQVARLLVVGYGTAGPTRSQLLADELQQAFDLTPGQGHVQDGAWRTRDIATGQWGRAHPFARTVPEAVLRGLTAPAASREALQASVAPLGEPLFGLMDTAHAAALSKLSPALRADIAFRALDTLTAGRIDDPVQMRILAHLASTDAVIADAVLGHAIGGDLRDARVDALVRTFRAAPTEQRPQLATTAAAATFLAGWNAPIVHGLLKHADALNGLTDLVSGAVHAGINPHPMRPGLAQAAQDGLKEAEDAWTAQRAPDKHSRAGFGVTDPPHTRQPPRPTGPAHGPAHPDGTQNVPEL